MMRISLPCAGIDGPSKAMAEGGWPIRATNIYETEAKLQPALMRLHRALGTDIKQLHVGKAMGDICGDGRLLQPSEGLIAGPPCPPWSALGKKRGNSDPRAAVFWQVLEDIRLLAQAGTLKFFVVENVVGIRKKQPGEKQPFVRELEDWFIAKSHGHHSICSASADQLGRSACGSQFLW